MSKCLLDSQKTAWYIPAAYPPMPPPCMCPPVRWHGILLCLVPGTDNTPPPASQLVSLCRMKGQRGHREAVGVLDVCRKNGLLLSNKLTHPHTCSYLNTWILQKVLLDIISKLRHIYRYIGISRYGVYSRTAHTYCSIIYIELISPSSTSPGTNRPPFFLSFWTILSRIIIIIYIMQQINIEHRNRNRQSFYPSSAHTVYIYRFFCARSPASCN